MEGFETNPIHQNSVFVDSFSDNDTCFGTIGTLYLKDGEKFVIGSGDDDAAHLANTAKNLMRGKNDRVLDLASKI